jgi:hypothetical protein
LHEVFRALLERGQNVFLVTHRRDHDDTGVAMLANDALDSLNAFHLRHGDVHEHDVRLSAIEFRDGGEAVASFSSDFAAEHLNHLDDVLASEDGVVHY